MRGSDRKAASTARASSGLSKASAAVLLVAMASLRILNSWRLAARAARISPTKNSTVVSSNAAPVDTSEMVLSFWRIGAVVVLISVGLVADDFRRPQKLRADREIARLRRRHVDAHANTVAVVDQHDHGAAIFRARNVGDRQDAASLEHLQGFVEPRCLIATD